MYNFIHNSESSRQDRNEVEFKYITNKFYLAMTTALVSGVSAFYDFGDLVYQKPKNRMKMDSRVVGSPVNNNNMMTSIRNRSSQSPILGNAVMGSKPSPPPSPTEMISIDDTTAVLLNHMNQLNQLPRKLERSVSDSQSDRNANQKQQNINSSRYKTEMCRPFEENGHCKYGDKCQFAHGINELRSLNRHPKYKTELCRTFHSTGICPYGPRCHFIHSESERKLSEINHVKSEQVLHDQQQFQQQMLVQAQNQLMNRSAQQQIPPRPKQLQFSMSLPLGSTADSPSSSVTDSPTMSPTNFMWGQQNSESDVFSPAPVQSAPPAVQLPTMFTFQDVQLVLEQIKQQQQQQSPVPSQCSLNVQTSPRQLSDARVQQYLNNCNNNISRDNNASYPSSMGSSESLYSAPSPTTAASFPTNDTPSCGSPLEVSRNLRLPIFKEMC
ncbi:unnamed protein product [Owenia fusiformis]|uniref:Uncharacterized protein n=1 Tax=Owenia fusiformis TaxID=6347 RepID=A0A8J1U5Q7_OWEFU|nr:unnamed protein product [Owenia fusiformis]